jgi:hypothetical protein
MRNTEKNATHGVNLFPMPPPSPRRHHRPATITQRRPAALHTAPRRSRVSPGAEQARPSLPDARLPPVLLGRYPFAGPFARWEELQHRAGLFAILACPMSSAQSYHPLYFGEADDLRQKMATLRAKSLLPAGPGHGALVYAALYTDLLPSARRHLVAELRTHYQLPTSVAGVASSLLPHPAVVRPALPRGRTRRKKG